MSATTDSLQDCIWSVEAHHFDNISVKCVFKCKNPGYKTYSKLHKHYLDAHKICLHRVARLDPNNEDEFRRQVTSFITSLTERKVVSQGARCGHVTPHATQPSAASPSTQIAGPSHLGGYQTPETTSYPTLGQDLLENSLGRYAGPVSAGGLPQNRGSRPTVFGEAGPSRPPAVYPTARHQPYPQSWTQQQGLYTNHSPVRGKAKGKGREIPLTAAHYGPPTSNTPSQGNYLEPTPSTTGPFRRTFARSPQRPSPDPGCSVPQQAATKTSMPAPWTPEPRHPIDATAPGNFHRPFTTREHGSPINSAPESEGPTRASHAWSTPPQRQQFHVLVTGSRGPVIHPPISPMGTSSSPDGSPRYHLPDQSRRSPRKASQRHSRKSLSPPAARTPSPCYAAKQLAPHPYPRPANGSTTPRLAQQARENRRRELPTETDVLRETLAHIAPPLGEEQVGAVMDVRYPAPDSHRDQDHGSLEAWEKEAAVPLVNRTAGKLTPPVLVVQEPDQKSALDQRHNLDRRHLTTAVDEEGEVPCTEECTQLPFPDISWEGWGLVKTSHGVYLPETFNPFSHVFEDPTDQWLYGQELGLEHMDCLEWPTPQDWVCVPTDELHIPSSYNSAFFFLGIIHIHLKFP